MKAFITCKRCGAEDLDLARYETLLALSSDLAVFTLRCPHCHARISAVCPIPPDLKAEVAEAASKMGAGMGGAHPASR